MAIDLVERNPSSQVTASQAARHAGMSVRSFQRYFPALTGYRFAEYGRKRRLGIAAHALQSTDHSILVVAANSGYDSHEAFTRAFAREFDTTPSEYRRHRTRREIGGSNQPCRRCDDGCTHEDVADHVCGSI